MVRTGRLEPLGRIRAGFDVPVRGRRPSFSTLGISEVKLQKLAGAWIFEFEHVVLEHASGQDLYHSPAKQVTLPSTVGKYRRP